MEIRVNKISRYLGIDAERLADSLGVMLDNNSVNPNTKLSIEVTGDDVSSGIFLKGKSLEQVASMHEHLSRHLSRMIAVEELNRSINKCRELGIPVDEIAEDILFKEYTVKP